MLLIKKAKYLKTRKNKTHQMHHNSNKINKMPKSSPNKKLNHKNKLIKKIKR